jgi:hypothetical protein
MEPFLCGAVAPQGSGQKGGLQPVVRQHTRAQLGYVSEKIENRDGFSVLFSCKNFNFSRSGQGLP